MSIRSFRRAHARRTDRARRRAGALGRRGGLAAGLALGATTLLVSNAQAATTYTVTTTADDASGGTCTVGLCTLRDALTAANADSTADTIQFAGGLTGTILLSNGALGVSGSGGVTIAGPGAGSLAISGGGASQVFVITATQPAAVSITGLTITDGFTTTDNGGAIDNTTTAALALTADTVNASSTTDEGGAIFSTGALTVSDSTVSGNTATGVGGGIAEVTTTSSYQGVLTISNSTISGNTGHSGGGVSGGRSADISDSQITGNQASASVGVGGGIQVGYGLNLQNSTVSGNSSLGGGGGIQLDPKYGVTIGNSTVSGNTSSDGGGIEIDATSAKYAPIRIQDSTISGNQAPNGAGLDVVTANGGSPVTVMASTLSGNTGGASSFGGGLLVTGAMHGRFELVDSTISGNSASSGGGVSLGGPTDEPLTGHDPGNDTSGSIAMENSTIAANTATSHGGGIYLSQYTSSGAPAVQESGTAAIDSTIVAGNSVTAPLAANDLERAATSTTGGFTGAFSLIQAPGSAPLTGSALIVGKDPMLGAAADSGGPTATMLPSESSPVIDQGHSPPSLGTDQRGDPRTVDTALSNPPGGDGTDIGAVELPAAGVVIPAPAPAPTPTPIPTPTPPPRTPAAGFGASIRGTALSGLRRALLVGNSTRVTCTVRSGAIAACVIEVRAHGQLLAAGEVTSPTRLQTHLSSTLRPTAAGLAVLRRHPLGVNATATAVASAAGSPSISARVHLLAGPAITLPLGIRTTRLSRRLRGELVQTARLITAAKSVTCTAYSDNPKRDASLTRAQAKAVCARLVKDGLKAKVRIVGKGRARPVASDRTRRGRAANRRVVVSFKL